jgi:long-subunit fatty acid transport protein
MKHDLSCSHRVSCDVIWYNWSEAFDRFDLRLSNPLVGTIPDSFPMNWKDTVSVRVGYEWMANCRDVWRLGYVYHDAPVPTGTLNPYTDGVLEHAFAVGLTRRYEKFLLSLAYQYSFGPERSVGASDIVGGDFSDSTFQAQAHWASGSVIIPF